MSDAKKRSSNRFPSMATLLWVLVFWLLVVYFIRTYTPTDYLQIPYSDFMKRVAQGEVSEVTFRGDRIAGVFKTPVKTAANGSERTYSEFGTTLPPMADPLEELERQGVAIRAESEMRPWFATILVTLIPWILIIGFFIYSGRKLRGMGGGVGGNPLGFGKSKARLYTKSNSNVTFQDVAGLKNAKKELSEIIDFLKDPSKYRALGGKLPKGVLLAGAPGTGKTLMARAAAGEADVPFYNISGSEFVEMFVGVGASRVRDLFENAKRDAPCIIFIDEIDSIGRVRGTGLGGGHDEREQTLNQILAEMDGFSRQETVVVMAATNRPDILDPALVRPGRFDRRVVLDLPQKKARKEILELHARRVPLDDDVDMNTLADRTVGFSGAELENLVNEAALLAARKGKKVVSAEDFDQSRDKVLMGLEREDIISDQEKRIIAYHEAGHALLAKLLPGGDPLQKVTIIPRGHSLGATEQIPEEDRHNLSRSYLLNRIAILLGGRVTERMIYRDITTGAGDDLKKATQMARRMVCQWGMSEKLGPVIYRQGEEHPYLGREMSEARDFSERTAQLIDEEIQHILMEMEKKAEEVLKANRDKLEILVEALLEQETLTREEVDHILNSGISQKAAARMTNAKRNV